MAEDIEKVFLEAVSREFLGLVIAGDEGVARGLVRSFAAALERCHAIGFSRDTEGWSASGGLQVVAVAGELTVAQGVRAALRQDPDYLVVEAPLAELPLDLLVTAMQTGHGALVRAVGSADERALVAALAALGWAASTFPRVVVVDARGVARIVSVPDGTVVWTRGAPLPSQESATGRKPYVPAPPPAREPTPPLDAAILEALRARLESHLRSTYVPVLVEASGDAARSKLSGLPLLVAGEEWPRCGDCRSPMPLAFQLARVELPEGARAAFPEGTEHLQLFYCTDGACSVRDPASPLSKNRLLRFIEAGAPAPSTPSFEQAFASRDIASWEEHVETPSSDDAAELDDDLRRARWQLRDRVDEGAASREEEALAGPRMGQKLLGWPAWAQGAEWVACPRCGERMVLIFQVDANEGALEMIFAADGTGHVSQCSRHRDALAFRWACG